jgi:hypothetical protein
MRRWFTVFTLSIIVAAAFIVQATADQVVEDDEVGVLISTGGEADAKQYYIRIAPKLGVASVEANLPDLTALLAHFGYGALTAEKLESDTPAALMTAFPNDQILAARFFAPKIVDFNNRLADPAYPYHAGWRKLVRLQTLAGSAADQAGLAAAYILFNHFQQQPADDPFASESVNTQVIIVPRSFVAGQEDAAYFLDYDTRTNKYAIHYFLRAAFDTLTPPKDPDTKQDYFLPTACAECHGHDFERGGSTGAAKTFPFAKLNYLDTDQWYDMMGAGDFPSTNGTLDVLYDGGLDHATQQYADVFAVIRKLNELIRAQNVSSLRSPPEDEFKVKAVEKWLAIHQTDVTPLPPIARALDLGGEVWQDTPADNKMLGLLSQYCFRCHSTVLYGVFDKQSVIDRSFSIRRRISLPAEDIFHMPQGRILDPTVIADMKAYLEQLP